MGDDAKTTKTGRVIQPIEKIPGGGDVHETFRTDKDGKPTDGHTTVRLPGDKTVHVPWTNE